MGAGQLPGVGLRGYETTQALLLLGGVGLAAVLAAPLGSVLVLSAVGALYVLKGAVAWATLPGGR